MKLYYLCILLILGTTFLQAQDKIEGMVMEANEQGKHLGLSGANVYWLNSPIGTITNDEGLFSIPFDSKYNKLVISYIGF